MGRKEIEIAKALLDGRKTKILHSIQKEPKTIKEIAKEINIDQSRLYYHINKLLNLGLIQVEREELVGNMVQKYYISKQIQTPSFTFSREDLQDESEYIVSKLYQYSNEAISTIARDIEEQNEDHHAEGTIIQAKLSKEKWRQLNEKIRRIIEMTMDEEEGDVETENFTYIIMSYTDEISK